MLEQARSGIRAGALADDRAVLDDLGCFGPFKGAGTVTAAAAAYLAARHAAQPAQGVLRAAFEQGADTDTLAAMTGGLLGCLAGDEWLPAPWRDVQDSAYLRCLAGRVAGGPSGVEQRPVEIPASPRSILTDLAWNGDHEVALGESTRVQATGLPDLKPASKSIAVRAWRLRTPEGQTLYVTRVERLKTAGNSRRAAGDSASHQRPLAGTGDSRAEHRESAVTDGKSESAGDRGDSIYMEFRRRLRFVMNLGPVRPKEIAEALDLVPGQARQWLEQAEQDGEIVRVSRNPVKFALSRRSLL